MDWAKAFYTKTGGWWVKADAAVSPRDLDRVSIVRTHAGGGPSRILELGAGYGTTMVALAEAGYQVTGIELSDRADAVGDIPCAHPSNITMIKGDFFEAQPPGPFDLVCYWNGFGIGADADQRRLLARIAREWLAPSGAALVDIFNPFVWSRWDGDEDHLLPDPEQGYDHELRQSTRFDPMTSTAIDTWWDCQDPTRKITQYLRCYSPSDLTLLLEGTGLSLSTIRIAGQDIGRMAPADAAALLKDHHEYLAVLVHDR